EVGDAIFFENVRDFVGRSSVNNSISDTISTQPERFLQLNNGIVFSANKVEIIDDTHVRLDRASIVNGCQTTISLVETEPNPGQEAYVQVKIVQLDVAGASWDVTHAANFQNEIARIDLDLARFIRPQLVRRQGYWSGIPVKESDDAWD